MAATPDRPTPVEGRLRRAADGPWSEVAFVVDREVPSLPPKLARRLEPAVDDLVRSLEADGLNFGNPSALMLGLPSIFLQASMAAMAIAEEPPEGDAPLSDDEVNHFGVHVALGVLDAFRPSEGAPPAAEDAFSPYREGGRFLAAVLGRGLVVANRLLFAHAEAVGRQEAQTAPRAGYYDDVD